MALFHKISRAFNNLLFGLSGRNDYLSCFNVNWDNFNTLSPVRYTTIKCATFFDPLTKADSTGKNNITPL
jgi:hypothetical protein